MPTQPLIAKGQPVEILKSSHPDIQCKSVGFVEDVFKDGYGVKLKSRFYGPYGFKDEERVIFFGLDDIKEVK